MACFGIVSMMQKPSVFLSKSNKKNLTQKEKPHGGFPFTKLPTHPNHPPWLSSDSLDQSNHRPPLNLGNSKMKKWWSETEQWDVFFKLKVPRKKNVYRGCKIWNDHKWHNGLELWSQKKRWTTTRNQELLEDKWRKTRISIIINQTWKHPKNQPQLNFGNQKPSAPKLSVCYRLPTGRSGASRLLAVRGWYQRPSCASLKFQLVLQQGKEGTKVLTRVLKKTTRLTTHICSHEFLSLFTSPSTYFNRPKSTTTRLPARSGQDASSIWQKKGSMIATTGKKWDRSVHNKSREIRWLGSVLKEKMVFFSQTQAKTASLNLYNT